MSDEEKLQQLPQRFAEVLSELQPEQREAIAGILSELRGVYQRAASEPDEAFSWPG